MIAFVFRIFVLSLAAVVVWFLFDFSWNEGELRVQYRFSKPAERIRGFIADEKERLAGDERLPLPVVESVEPPPSEGPVPAPLTELPEPPSSAPEPQRTEQALTIEETLEADTAEEPESEVQGPVIPEESRREIEKLIRESM